MTFSPEIGSRFGKWTVLSAPVRVNANRKVECRCDCGTTRLVDLFALRHGKSNSCIYCRPAKHERHDSPEYRIWHNMKQRCLNPNHPSFKNYGGRGITLCEEWHDFARFFADMGERPSVDHSLEREDNDGPYCKSNCVWADWDTQCNNKRQSRFLTFNGITLSVTQWSRKLGMSYATLEARIRKGWSIERALTEPVNLAFKRR